MVHSSFGNNAGGLSILDKVMMEEKGLLPAVESPVAKKNEKNVPPSNKFESKRLVEADA